MDISQLEQRIDGLYPNLEAFNGTVLIHLLKFLTTLYEAFNCVGSLEPAEVFNLTYYLEEEAM